MSTPFVRPFSMSDDDVRSALDQVISHSRDRSTHSPSQVRRDVDELDRLAEEMIGRRGEKEETLRADIQAEVLRREPDRSVSRSA